MKRKPKKLPVAKKIVAEFAAKGKPKRKRANPAASMSTKGFEDKFGDTEL